ncbi:iron-containing alcohol dehydrogenase family protein [Ammonifex thiophilus]|uniref:Iron-containing alcohol dehydrogenase n=1 Tax=Ammonifex thiophilus TaxID=444093 RepID=A0A3D8P6A7_9THEO|nr:iron-containing alcohol dehydrogenase [Ammonifex thiophilus]RDV84056.1 iron-containing alcohol dehydrogenase [Ammonifex thiophilus]
MLFDLYLPARVLFGPGSTYRLGEEAQRFGNKVLLVTGRRSLKESGNFERVTMPFVAAKLEFALYDRIPPEPTLETVEDLRHFLREEKCDVVVAVGGGSVLDTVKAAAGLFYEEGTVKEYFYGREITKPKFPWIAVPTTAGSGSEATTNAVLKDPEVPKKQSLRHPFWLPDVAVVDPILTMSLPRELTARTGLDALTHAVEAYTCRFTNPFSDAVSREAVRLIVQNIYTAYAVPRNRDARERMMQGSFLAGMAIQSAGVGAVHALAHVLGARYNLPHGLACGMLLPHVMSFNLPLVEDKYAQLAVAAGIVPPATPAPQAAERFVGYVRLLTAKLGLPTRLREVGVKEEDLPSIVEEALTAGSMARNPRRASREDLLELLKAMF